MHQVLYSPWIKTSVTGKSEVKPQIIHWLLSVREMGAHWDPTSNPHHPFSRAWWTKSHIWPSLNLAEDGRWSWALLLHYNPLRKVWHQIVRGCVESSSQSSKTTWRLLWVFFFMCGNEQRPSEKICGPCDHLAGDLSFSWCERGAGWDSEVLTEFCFQSWVCLSDSKGCWTAWIEAKENVDANPAK